MNKIREALAIIGLLAAAVAGTLAVNNIRHSNLREDILIELKNAPEISSIEDYSDVFRIGKSSLVSDPSDNVLAYPLESRRFGKSTLPYYNVCFIGENGVSAAIFANLLTGHKESKNPRLLFDYSRQNDFEDVAASATAACETVAQMAMDAS